MFERGRVVGARASTADGQTWTSSACWYTRNRASRGNGSLATSLAGLGPQYATRGNMVQPEASRLSSTGGQAVAQASCLPVPWCLPGRMSERDLILLSVSPNGGARTVEGNGVRRGRIGDQMHGVEYHKKMER